jgi:tRNA 2-thiouridine synthesizing protein A
VTDDDIVPVRVLDLRGVSCPLNYVKTRVALEKVDSGEWLEVWLDHGEAEENVPRSCEEDGFPVQVLADGDGYARLLVSR